MNLLRLSLYEIRKRITFPVIALVLLSVFVIFLYSLTFEGVIHSDGNLYDLLRGYEKAVGERKTLLDNDAEAALMEFYNARIDVIPSGNETFFVEGDIASLAIEDFFRHEKYFFDDSHGPEVKKLIRESSSLLTANLMEKFHWTMFWTTVFVSVAVALICSFIGRKEDSVRSDVIDSTLNGKETKKIRFYAVLICSLVVTAAGMMYVIIREAHAAGAGAMKESIYGRYAFELGYNTGNISFGAYVALALVAFALFSIAFSAFNSLIAVLLDGGTAVFVVIPAEVLLQSFLAKIIWLNGFNLDWQLGGVAGFLFGGGGGRYETMDFKIISPVMAGCLAILFAGNILTFILKRRIRGLRK